MGQRRGHTYINTDRGPSREWLHKIGRAASPMCPCGEAVQNAALVMTCKRVVGGEKASAEDTEVCRAVFNSLWDKAEVLWHTFCALYVVISSVSRHVFLIYIVVISFYDILFYSYLSISLTSISIMSYMQLTLRCFSHMLLYPCSLLPHCLTES